MEQGPMDNDLRKDTTNVALGITASGLVFVVWIAVRIVIPDLLNMHNDGALLLVVLVAILTASAAYIGGRVLLRLINNLKGE